MNLYFAPLEGITTNVYRTTHAAVFGSCDRYFAPFITPSDNERVSRKGLRDVVPEKNEGTTLTVQVLTSRSDSFLKFARKIKALGYREININLGCPFPRVVQKGRGAGMLQDAEALDRFLDGIFSSADISVSIKTRTGFYSGEEMARLMEVYNEYPIRELTIHPRAREEFYKGTPDMAAFSLAYNCAKMPVCYNGDIETAQDFADICKSYPDLSGVMIGRGAITNPAIFREIRGGAPLSLSELVTFSETLMENYYATLGSEVFTLQKLKEVWGYMAKNVPNETKILKGIKKASSIEDLSFMVKQIK